mmetsp:Transcript_12348/g.33988  ORF Transcript_12348/g.33988 Transcript_12348/m.33988 type:complete len:205 (-) Transcript_12348:577-1191(-)
MDFTMPLPTLSVICTTLSSSDRAGRRAAVEKVADGAFAAGADASATYCATSSAVTRPPLPVPVTLVRSIPSALARARTFGVARTPGALVLLAGDGLADDELLFIATGAGGALDAACGTGDDATGAGALADSISTSVAPTFTTPPTAWCTFFTFPVKGLVNSTEALSLSTEQRLSISLTESPSLTNHSVNVTSAIPSPMSANLNS